MLLTNSNKNLFYDWLDAARTDGAFALIDKASGWTSFDVVNKLRRMTGIKKVGHAGTLDPLATGLLIIAFGRATKQISDYTAQRKVYSAEFKFGAKTVTDDAEGEETDLTNTDHIKNEDILMAANDFTGKILQVPPNYSAKKINGKRLYELARKNKEINVQPAEVEIVKFEISDITLPVVKCIIECSKGTYIRSLARDMGDRLGVGAYLLNLRRTEIGDYSVNNALTINQIIELNEVRNENLQNL